jgi:hypothetical protein
MSGISNFAETTTAMEGVVGMSFVMLGIIFIIYGIYNFGTMIFRTDTHPDDYMGSMFKSMFGIVLGGVMLGSNMNSDTVGVLKYVGIGIGCLVVAGIVGGITMFFVGIKKYKNYIKKTNELLLLKEDFLVLSSNLQTIEDQIVLNSKMAEDLNKKKKEELTFLNSLLTEKRIRFNGMIADVRSSISL